MTIGERLREIRKSSGLSQGEFGARIGITFSAVSSIERGANSPSGSTVTAICSEFGVNRTWLETGEGEMYQADDPNSAEDLVPELVERLNSYPALLDALRSATRIMTDDDWAMLNGFVTRLVDANKKED